MIASSVDAIRAQRTPSIALLVAAGIVIRLALVIFTAGTTDLVFMMVWARLALKFGVAGAYAQHELLNHPPLGLGLVAVVYRVADVIGIEYTDLLRIVQIAADAGTFALLLRLGQKLESAAPRRAALVFFLSPVAFLISGFHCNNDSTMLFFVVAAVAAWIGPPRRPFVAGVLLAAATGVKIPPLLLAPLFTVAGTRRDGARFAGGFALASAAIFGPAVATGGVPVLRNIFLYRGAGDWWGLRSMLKYAGRGDATLAALAELYARIAAPLLLIVVFAVMAFVVIARRRGDLDEGRLLISGVTATLSLVVVTGSGFGVQYLVWPLALLAFAIPLRAAIVVHAVLSAFLVTVYTVWAGEFPWWFADANAVPTPDWLVVFGWVAWGVLLGGALAALRTATLRPERRDSAGTGREVAGA